jgi:hypothetical protein
MSTFILQPLPAGEVDVDAPVTVQMTAVGCEPFAGPGRFAFRVDRA